VTAVAPRLAALLTGLLGTEPPVRLRAWDGSEAGPAGAPAVVLRSPLALRRLLWRPGELGLAQAYIAGDLDVDGDLAEGLSRVWRAVRERGPRPARPGPRAWAAAAGTAVRLGAAGPPPPAPDAPLARLRGRRHTTGRDRAAISHHYDLSNAWYELLLDPSMAYSCGYWTRPGAEGYGLADAQRDKLDLVCRKLGLTPGARLLDVGCGWGSLTAHAAGHYGARVTAVTLSREQRDFAVARMERAGLADRVEVLLRHYRDLPVPADGGGYDAVATLEMGEHVGDAQYPGFARRLHAFLRPGGRLLVQQMSRGTAAPGGGAFIESYIAPDMHMRPVGGTVGLLEDAGLEVRSVESLREHYVRTIAAWHRTLEDRWPQFVALGGEPTARVWRLYLAGAGLAFAERRMGVDQILAVRPHPAGASGLPPTPAAWYGAVAEPAR
jgi:cyclopropane-fatty-acyl-phospholipid synthase